MRKQSTLVLAALLALSSSIFAQTAPVKHLAGKSETGQPHLYWFGAAAVESTLYYDDGTAEWPIFVVQPWADNQVLVRFLKTANFYVVTELSAFILRDQPSDTGTFFSMLVLKDTGNFAPGQILSTDTLSLNWNGQLSMWAQQPMNVLLTGDTSFWGALYWFSDYATNPRIGDDRSNNFFQAYIGYQDSFFLWTNGGNLMIRAKVMANDPMSEAADSFWVYRGLDSNSVFHVNTVNLGLFDFTDTPPSSGNYYYRVSRWDNDLESPLSNAIMLSASPTSVKNREKNQSVFLLSEPFPNPFSIGVLFTARTEKQMELGFSIYNLLGQKVFSQSSQTFSAGEHRFHWRGEDASGTKLPSGAYFLRFQAGEETIVKKLLLLR